MTALWDSLECVLARGVNDARSRLPSANWRIAGTAAQFPSARLLFVDKAALKRIRDDGIARLLVDLGLDGPPLVSSNDEHWPIIRDGQVIGRITSAIHSPCLEENIALAMVAREHAEIGTRAVVDMPADQQNGKVVPKLFYAPKKPIAARS